MKFSDFGKQLGADPWNRDPEFLKARHSEPGFEAAAREAEVFEGKLEAALEAGTPRQLVRDLLAITSEPAGKPERVSRYNPWWLTMAAGLFMAIGAGAVILWQQRHYSGVEDYVHRHMNHDGQPLLVAADARDGVSREAVDQVFSGLAARIDESLLPRIRYVKTCPTPNGKGAHFVIETPEGLVTVIYMPDTRIAAVSEFSVEGQRAHVVPLRRGALAIIGNNDGQIQALTPVLESGIQLLRADI